MPCIGALADYGIDAVPRLVEAYFEETKEEKRRLIQMALRLGKVNREAAIYAQGLVAGKTDRETQVKLQLFLAAMKSL